MPHHRMLSVFAPQGSEQLRPVEGKNHIADRGRGMEIVHFNVHASPRDGPMTDADEAVGDRREIYYFELVAGLLDRVAIAGTKIGPGAIQGDHRMRWRGRSRGRNLLQR